VTGAAAECNQALQILQSAPYSPNLYVDYCTGNSGMPGSQWDRVISQWDRIRPERCLAVEAPATSSNLNDGKLTHTLGHLW
jgi:hypothetical protein